MSDEVVLVEVRVDRDLCVGVGQCEALAAHVLRVSDDGVAEVVAPGLLERSLADAVIEACPTGAISVAPGKNDSMGRGAENRSP